MFILSKQLLPSFCKTIELKQEGFTSIASWFTKILMNQTVQTKILQCNPQFLLAKICLQRANLSPDFSPGVSKQQHCIRTSVWLSPDWFLSLRKSSSTSPKRSNSRTQRWRTWHLPSNGEHHAHTHIWSVMTCERLADDLLYILNYSHPNEHVAKM